MKLCTNCGQAKPVEDFYVRNKKTGTLFVWCKKCLGDYSINSHAAIKTRAIRYKGGRCMICGYDKCQNALVFHHLDPTQKDFGIAQNRTRKWEKIVPELDKCVLLCQNCHSEVHAGITPIPRP